MRIGIVAHHHLEAFQPHGGELSMLAIARHLRPRCEALEVLVDHKKGPQRGIDARNGIVYRLKEPPLAQTTIRNWIDYLKPTVILTWGRVSMTAARVCADQGIPCIVFVRYWDMGFMRPFVDLEKQAQRGMWRRCFESAGAVIANSPFVRSCLESVYDLDNIATMYSPVDAPAEKWKRTPKFITVVNPAKGQGGAILGALAKRNPNWDFLSIGVMGEQPNLKVRPYSEEPYWAMLADTAVLLFPFDEEPCGTGRVVSEAYHLGIPVIAPNWDGFLGTIPPTWMVSENKNLGGWEQRIRQVRLGQTVEELEFRDGFLVRTNPADQFALLDEILEDVT